jgi:hypothetical protein
MGETTDKVPSEISYEHRSPKWGYDLEPWVHRHGWFKLLLDPMAGETKYNNYISSMCHSQHSTLLLPSQKTPVNICSDYLTEIYKHTMKTLEARYQSLGTTVIRFVITTLSIRGVKAQNDTLKTAKRAGFGSRRWPDSRVPLDMVELVAETEAAAIYSLKNFHKGYFARGCHDEKFDMKLTSGTQVIVCDAGGCTVDRVAYEITKVQPKLEMNETTRARGGLCGATSLDRAFLKLVEKKLGSQGWVLTAEQTVPEAAS